MRSSVVREIDRVDPNNENFHHGLLARLAIEGDGLTQVTLAKWEEQVRGT